MCVCVGGGAVAEGGLGCGLNVCVLFDLFDSFIKLLKCNSPSLMIVIMRLRMFLIASYVYRLSQWAKR